MHSEIPNLQSPHPRPRPAFSLVELLVVIGIISILMGILFPVLSKVRSSAQRTRAESVLHNIANAVGAYQLQFRSYPGPIANAYLDTTASANNANIANLTGAENLVLGLSGGLIDRGAGPLYDRNLLGTGPRIPVVNGRQYPPFLEGVRLSDSSLAHFVDAENNAAADSAVPEFLDGYDTDPLPVLYLRANVGKLGIARDDLDSQYDARALYPYTQHLRAGSTVKHGLQALGADGDAISGTNPNNVIPYLRSTTLGGSPRTPDGFILIGAGPDRIYGTADDITSFGPVIP